MVPSRHVNGISGQEEREDAEDVGLTFAEGGQRANVAQLQVSEVLSDKTYQDYDNADLAAFLAKLQKAVRNCPAAVVPSTAAGSFLAFLGVPEEVELDYPGRSKEVQAELLGSFRHRVWLREGPHRVDLRVQLPGSCFQPKDYLNHKYFAKCALYLAHLDEHLAAKKLAQRRRWTCMMHNPRKLGLVVEASGKLQGVQVRIFPAAPAAAFKLLKLAPDHNTLRTAINPQARSVSGEGLAPTPQTNNAVLNDVIGHRHLQQLAAALTQRPWLRELVLLLKLWRNNCLADHSLAVPDTLLATVVLRLHAAGRLMDAMTRLQGFRAALAAIGEAESYSVKGIFSRTPQEGADDVPPPPPPKLFAQVFPVVVLDCTGWVNLACMLSRATQSWMCASAKRAAAALAKPHLCEEVLDQLFHTQQSLASLWDYLYFITPPRPQASDGPGSSGSTPARLSHDLPHWQAHSNRAEMLAKQGLAARFLQLAAAPAALRVRHPAKAPPQPASPQMVLAAHVDPERAWSTLERGPSATLKAEAKAFREFWGEKSELRRFPDGEIAEAVVWEAAPGRRHLVLHQVLEHVLKRHLGSTTHVHSVADALDEVLPESDLPAAHSEVAAGKLGTAMRKLSQQLLNLQGAVLKVVAAQPLSEAIRRTAASPLLPHPLAGADAGASSTTGSGGIPRCLEPVEVMVQLESSGRWPARPDAYAKMRAAVGCQLAVKLQEQFGTSSSASEANVDVLLDGFAFRLLLWSERDEKLLKVAQQLPAGSPLPAHLPRNLPLLAWHHGTVSHVASRFPAYAPAVRLASCWLASQGLSNHVSLQAVELLMAACFADPAPAAALGAPPPASRTTAFLRWLQVIAEWPWQVRPLVLDPKAEMTAQDCDAALSAFTSSAPAGQAGAGAAAARMVICTAQDRSGTTWTGQRPEGEMLQRLRHLARQALQSLQARLQAAPRARPRSILAGGDAGALWLEAFSPSIQDFDLLLLLSQEAVPSAGPSSRILDSLDAEVRGAAEPNPLLHLDEPVSTTSSTVLDGEADQEAVPPSKRARVVLDRIPSSVVRDTKASQLRKQLLVGFHPVRHLLQQLELRFGHLAWFCADDRAGRHVGVRWKPASFLPAAPEVSTMHTAAPLSFGQDAAAAGMRVVPDVMGVVQEMRQIGAGLISDVVFL